MKTKTVYQTDALGRFTGSTEAEESPLEPGIFLIPGGCVTTPPPTPDVPLRAAYWSQNKWVLADYFNGLIVYSMQTGEPLTVEGQGPIPSGYTMKKPGPDQVWKDDEWVDDINAILAALHAQKLEDIAQACNRYIEGGFTSDALGALHHYNSELTDQINLTGLMLSELDSGYSCYDDQHVKAFRPHTATQLNQVGKDLTRFKQAALQHADNLKQALGEALRAKKLNAMRAIQWTPPV